MKPTISETLCYSSKTFSITCDEVSLSVYREKDKELIETFNAPSKEVCLTNNTTQKIELEYAFEDLKTKYIFDYSNVL